MGCTASSWGGGGQKHAVPTSQLGCVLVGISAVCSPHQALLQTHFWSLIGGNASLPIPMEAVVTSGGMSMVHEENESDINMTQIDCTVMGVFPLFSS